MTAVLDTVDTSQTEVEAGTPLASWPARAGAIAIDVLLGVAVIATMAVSAWSAPWLGWLWWVYVATAACVIVAMAVNRLLLPTITGWSLGRAVFGIAVRTQDGAAPGVLRLVGRDLVHLLDTAALFVGWLWPLWDGRRRTFADLLLRTEVHAVESPAERPQRDTRRPAAIALIVATVLCAAAVGLGYLVVYRPERAVDVARQQIAEQGPRIVEQMLSYNSESLQQDFSRAQSLTTDSYRDQLIAQQQLVQQSGATSNEYFAVSSAVLSATAEQASMLIALQGQRGTDPKDLKFITATLRVEFEKTADGQWKVANLIVLKKPQMNAPGQ
ncbi:RDD family protein [Mycobacterium gallinarum]|uniref:RDD family protein n=1 Tax=Mycobacterium gallinarum TaxID=39689 RepID=A0A9W4B6W3_9MYCO|nr:RDD family protein [Mycobacterium gallinarum]BBY94980.1 RDD family protein [Mycobacterium gallinarum]